MSVKLIVPDLFSEESLAPAAVDAATGAHAARRRLGKAPIMICRVLSSGPGYSSATAVPSQSPEWN